MEDIGLSSHIQHCVLINGMNPNTYILIFIKIDKDLLLKTMHSLRKNIRIILGFRWAKRCDHCISKLCKLFHYIWFLVAVWEISKYWLDEGIHLDGKENLLAALPHAEGEVRNNSLPLKVLQVCNTLFVNMAVSGTHTHLSYIALFISTLIISLMKRH